MIDYLIIRANPNYAAPDKDSSRTPMYKDALFYFYEESSFKRNRNHADELYLELFNKLASMQDSKERLIAICYRLKKAVGARTDADEARSLLIAHLKKADVRGMEQLKDIFNKPVGELVASMMVSIAKQKNLFMLSEGYHFIGDVNFGADLSVIEKTYNNADTGVRLMELRNILKEKNLI
jgi:hypothetical protein